MWTETQDGREVITELAKTMIAEVGPDEVSNFDNLLQEYFNDPTPPDLSVDDGDEDLAFGISGILVNVTPAAAAIATSVISFIVTEVINIAKEESSNLIRVKVKGLLKIDSDKKDEKNTSVPSFTKEQLKRVKELAREQAIIFGIDEARSDKLVNSLIGLLVTDS